ncbi:hypothetical protein BGY98DRAFT_1179571 [Russula aff. rugulosa BPL654]|nr:hypothetical protein BGY98DRAFT_1179571 [Russula aff. rugulosa BPL654]
MLTAYPGDRRGIRETIKLGVMQELSMYVELGDSRYTVGRICVDPYYYAHPPISGSILEAGWVYTGQDKPVTNRSMAASGTPGQLCGAKMEEETVEELGRSEQEEKGKARRQARCPVKSGRRLDIEKLLAKCKTFAVLGPAGARLDRRCLKVERGEGKKEVDVKTEREDLFAGILCWSLVRRGKRFRAHGQTHNTGCCLSTHYFGFIHRFSLYRASSTDAECLKCLAQIAPGGL